MTAKRIYLDHNATTPLRPEVLEEMLPFLKNEFGNPSSSYSEGRKAREAVEEARSRISEAIGAKEDEVMVIFTSGGTEANNLAISGLAAKFDDPHIITSSAEHKSVLETCKKLKEKNIAEVTFANPDSEGLFSNESISSSVKANTAFVSLMLANNETGVINSGTGIPGNLIWHSDAVQAFGKIPVNILNQGMHLLSLSSHKINGPKGAGALCMRKGILLEPLFCGGSQERHFRPGTENVAAIVGFGKAAELAMKELDNKIKKETELRDYFQNEILKKIENVSVNGHLKRRLSNTLNISFHGLESQALASRLDEKGISVSTGSACSSGLTGPSHVLKGMGKSAVEAYSSIRFSIGFGTSKNDLDHVLNVLVKLISEMRPV